MTTRVRCGLTASGKDNAMESQTATNTIVNSLYSRARNIASRLRTKRNNPAIVMTSTGTSTLRPNGVSSKHAHTNSSGHHRIRPACPAPSTASFAVFKESIPCTVCNTGGYAQASSSGGVGGKVSRSFTCLSGLAARVIRIETSPPHYALRRLPLSRVQCAYPDQTIPCRCINRALLAVNVIL